MIRAFRQPLRFFSLRLRHLSSQLSKAQKSPNQNEISDFSNMKLPDYDQRENQTENSRKFSIFSTKEISSSAPVGDRDLNHHRSSLMARELESIFEVDDFQTKFRNFWNETPQNQKFAFQTSLIDVATSRGDLFLRIVHCCEKYLPPKFMHTLKVQLLPLCREEEKDEVFKKIIFKSNSKIQNLSSKDSQIFLNFIYDQMMTREMSDLFSFSEIESFADFLDKKLQNQTLGIENVPDLLFLIEADRHLRISDNRNFYIDYLLKNIDSYYDKLSWRIQAWLWKVVLGSTKPTTSEIKKYTKMIRLDTYQDIVVSSVFWAHFMLSSSVRDVSIVSQSLHNFRARIAPSENLLANLTQAVHLSLRLVDLRNFLTQSKHSKNERYQAKSVCRSFETFLFQVGNIVAHKIKDETFEFKIESCSSFFSFANEILNIYKSYGITAPPLFNEVVEEQFSKNLPNVSDIDFSAMSNFVLSTGSLSLKKKTISELSNRVRQCLTDQGSDYQINRLIYWNSFFSYDIEGVDTSQIFNIFDENLSFWDDKITRSQINFLKVVTIFTVNKKFSSKLVHLFIRKCQEGAITLTSNSAKLYLQCKLFGDPTLISESSDEIKQLLQNKSRNSNKKIQRSFLQMNFEATLKRNNIPFFFEYNLYDYNVDIFISPNIVIEIIGNCHSIQGKYDKFLATKIETLEKLGYRVVLINNEDCNNYDTREKFINYICQLYESSSAEEKRKAASKPFLN